MDTGWGAHIAIAFTETHHSTVASPTEKQEVRAVWGSVIRGKNGIVSGLFPHFLYQSMAFGIVVLQQSLVTVESLPNFHQRRENVASYRPLRSENSKNPTATQKRLEINSETVWKMRNNPLRMFLFIPNPLQKLSLERHRDERRVFGRKQRTLKLCIVL